MRSFIFIFSIFCCFTKADEFHFKASEYDFIPRRPIFIFEIPQNEAGEKLRVSFAQVRSKVDGQIVYGAALPEDFSDPISVEVFGGTNTAYIEQAVLEGRNTLSKVKLSPDERVTLGGKPWAMSTDAKVIKRFIKSNKDGEREYAHICRISLRPWDRIRDVDAPEKTRFCKPIKSIQVQEMDLEGKPSFDKNGAAIMSDTVVCPIPANCVKREWAIEPDRQINPEEFAGTVHALAHDQAIVHKEAPVPMEMP